MKIVSSTGKDITAETLIWGSAAVLFAVLVDKMRKGCRCG